jgi:para-nitrobenzyl esterase
MALRALTSRQLTAGAPPWLKGLPPLMPVVDGVLLPAVPEILLTPGAFADVPVLTGIDGDEASAFSGHLVKSMSQAAWRELLEKTFGALAPRFAPLYPAATDAERARSARRLHHDLGLAALYRWNQLWSAHAHSATYVYLFDHMEPGPESSRWGKFHSSELPYVFGTLGAAPERRCTAVDGSISTQLMRYWLDFVKTGNPNGAGLAKWPAMGPRDPKVMAFAGTPRPRAVLPPRKLSAMQAFIASGGKPGIF